jgi:hypothetical protein
LITWTDGSVDGYTKLDSSIDVNKVEKVKYIPQSFLEKLCVSEEDSAFEEEIKKIIFSHTPVSERMGFSSLEELITYKSEIINKDLGIIKGEVDDLNQRIINIEKKTSDGFKQSLNESLSAKQTELENHNLLKPKPVDEPKNDPGLEERNQYINSQITEIKSAIEHKTSKQAQLNESKAKALIELGELEKSKQSIETLRGVANEAYKTQQGILQKYGIDISTVITFQFDLNPIDILLKEKQTTIANANRELNGSVDEASGIEIIPGLNDQIVQLNAELGKLEDKLDEPNRIYQKYLKDVHAWAVRRDSIIGDVQTFGTIRYFESQLEYLEKTLPTELSSAIETRNTLLRKLFAKKLELVDLYKLSYKPISDFISKYGHMMKDYEINLSAEFTIDGFTEKFFDQISQGAKGTYIGIEEGNKYLSELIPAFDFNDVESVIEFLSNIRESLLIDKRPDQKEAKRDLDQQLKKGYTQDDFYRFLYGLDYLKPTFRLNLGTKTLSELSPGERGALLLIFYLFLDKDDRPLIIDQPEENLDNQSVYNYLVHFIKEAKKRRQIIIVTHNPNLAVVCDAEQVIHMSIDKQNSNTVSFKSGAIENPTLNKAIIDILEGTRPAFKNRTDKYESVVNRFGY